LISDCRDKKGHSPTEVQLGIHGSLQLYLRNVG
jgi:hypothetical protein